MTRKEQVMQKALIESSRKDMVKEVDKYVQSTIDRYNKANGTMFEKVHNCAAYAGVDGYTHQQFCKDILAHNANVWETARNIEADVVAGNRDMPTTDELINELPDYMGV